MPVQEFIGVLDGPENNELLGPLSAPAKQLLNAQEWQNMPRIPREAGAPGNKGLGYFGALPNAKGGYSTELAGEQDGLHFPLMVPTLIKEEVDHLLSGQPATPSIWEKAYQHAISRGRGAKDAFATQYDKRTPRP